MQASALKVALSRGNHAQLVSAMCDLSVRKLIKTWTVNSQDSSTFKVVDANGFKISYADGTGAQGDYFTDVLSFGGQTLTNQTMGIAYESTLSPGLLGIGYDQNEASTGDNPPFVYSSVIDSLVTQGLISLKAYSLYLDDLEASTGSLLFGGLDSDKYQGNLVQMPIIPQTVGGQTLFTAFAVDMVSLAVSSSPGNSTPVTQSAFDIPVILDSGTTLTYVPESLLLDLVNQLNGAVDQQGFPFVDCSLRDDNAGLTFDFGLGTSDRIVIKVPAAELIYDSDVYTGGSTPDVSLQNPCALGFQAQNGAPYVLGDNFLRSAYVVYDLKNNLIALGQTNFDSTTSSILDFSADATTIPVRSGVATSAVVEPTASGGTATTDGSGGETTSFPQTEFTAATASTTPFTIPGNGLPTLSSSTDSFASPSNSASSSSSTQKSSPAVASAELDRGGLAVVGISLIFAVLGGGWFLA